MFFFWGGRVFVSFFYKVEACYRWLSPASSSDETTTIDPNIETLSRVIKLHNLHGEAERVEMRHEAATKSASSSYMREREGTKSMIRKRD